MGFISSPLDPCFYRRPISSNAHDPTLAQSDAIIILHVDDMRVAAYPTVLATIKAQLYAEFEITTSDTGRFLGMDVNYDLANGILKMHMNTYSLFLFYSTLKFSPDMTKLSTSGNESIWTK